MSLSRPIRWCSQAAFAAVFLGCSAGLQGSHAAAFRTLYGFGAPTDGINPEEGLAIDRQGRLYGATYEGGSGGRGTIFRLDPPTAKPGTWTEEVLYSFSGPDGEGPNALLLGSSGEIYGTTGFGGPANLGTVFRLDPIGAGWALTTLHAFQTQADGSSPLAPLTFGTDGLLYGSTVSGGTSGLGNLFSISPAGDPFEYATIYQFGTASKVFFPSNALVQTGKGFLGTTANGFPGGSVFRISPDPAGGWAFKVLHAFGFGEDFSGPSGPLIKATNGVFYGCGAGGRTSKGGVYSLTHTPPDLWTETILYSFGTMPNDPDASACGVTLAPSGQIIGTSFTGGIYGQGTVFSLTPPAIAGQPWSFAVLHNFLSKSSGGANPVGPLVRKGDQYYGNTEQTMGVSPYGPGVVYRLTP